MDISEYHFSPLSNNPKKQMTVTLNYNDLQLQDNKPQQPYF